MPSVVFSIMRRSRGLQNLFMPCGLVLFGGWVMNPVSHGQELQSSVATPTEKSGVVAGEANPAGVSSEARRLVEALGSDSYATRMQARVKLQRMGLEAIDELRRATNDLDSEISLTAKAIVASYSIVWFTEDDPDVVYDALEGYGAESIPERQARISMLAEFPDRIGLPALVRIARFESSTDLSRRATMEIMGQAVDKDPAKRKANAALIKKGLGLSTRQATEWLQVYANDLASGEYSADEWRSLVRKQRDAVDSLSSEEITRESILSLVRICAVQAASSGNEEEALRLATENLDLIPATTNDLIEACTWATDNQLYPLVFGLYAQPRPMFDRSAILLYGYAFALQGKGDEEQAVRVAEDAFRSSPLAQSEDVIKAMQPRELEEIAKLRREIAVSLRARGMFQWAEREYAHVIDAVPIVDRNSVLCRSDLSIMFGELDRHQDVVDLLGPLIDRMEKDDEFKAKLMADQNIAGFIKGWGSRVEYHKALLDIKKHAVGDADDDSFLEKARQRMMAAYIANPRDIDVLIKMYRTQGDKSWRSAVKSQLRAAEGLRLSTIKNYKDALTRGGLNPQKVQYEEALAEALNNYAWLICNTEGDFEQALKYSLESLEIREDSAKLDTCGRCYFALGDLDNAIRVQKKALALEPHSPPLKRQLREFEQAKMKAEVAAENAEAK